MFLFREPELKQRLRKRGGLWHQYFQILLPPPGPLIYADSPFSDRVLQVHSFLSKKVKDHNMAVLDTEQNTVHEGGPNPRNLLSQ